MAPISKLFFEHPKTVNETYFQHMGVALRFAGTLGIAAGAALVHAVVPAFCEKTASKAVDRLHAQMRNRH